ncbi:glycerophosphodiester phosphodiesterase [Fervidibacillus halotolerans]|uniref:Glycerophosphodiester phosphodiesterase n=1 Tax=Fervidibacillus halotolerans TaxID=2980027 RepID=A0A9E8LYM3_9BACI|nr:glycerophosphodiester phosphodiesterase [Fervidibacillus halotolerans]WAA11411.1 glycerophosphodiester phosphodiesterase [Fervidibacillus halotolerans]
MTQIFAHRGSSGTRPENTMIAFYEAEKNMADGIELDVQLSKDGKIVIIHDQKVDRTTDGKGFVKDFTLDELQKLDAGYRFQSGKYPAKIPTLEQFLSWFKRTEMICNIELKTTSVTNHELEEKVIGLIQKYDLDDRIIISSFNHYAIVYSYRLAPHIETAPLFMEGLYMPWVYAESIKAKAIHPHYKVAPKELIQISEKEGIKVRPFTVNKEKDLKMYMEIGASAVISDYPALARKVKDQL